VRFDPRVPRGPGAAHPAARAAAAEAARPARLAPVAAAPRDADLAWQPVAVLAELLRTGRVTSTRLTRLAIERMKRHDPVLKCVITLTEERALRSAAAADAEIAAGRYRGPLHGIPYGAKGPTLGARLPDDVGRGPVPRPDDRRRRRGDPAAGRGGRGLVAKLSLGELAQGDVWFGRGPTDAAGDEAKTRSGVRTRNPWKTDQGSSGSSAGPASAVAGGPRAVRHRERDARQHLVAEHAVRRDRAAADVRAGAAHRGDGALVVDGQARADLPHGGGRGARAAAIHGPDGRDLTCAEGAVRVEPHAAVGQHPGGLRQAAFDLPAGDPNGPPAERFRHPTKPWDDAALAVLQGRLGVRLRPVALPDAPWDAMRVILTAEAAAAFDSSRARSGTASWCSRGRATGPTPSARRGSSRRWTTSTPTGTARWPCRRGRGCSRGRTRWT
jgi:hypothetical protein